MKIDLHTITDHTHNCRNDIDRLIDHAKDAGLDAIAIADTDTMSACGLALNAAENMMIIPGMKINTDLGTHLIGLFLNDEIVARDIFEVIDEIHAQGGLVVVPYPYRPRVGLLYNRYKKQMYTGEDMTRIMSRVDLIEACTYGAQPDEIAATEQYLQSVPDIPLAAGSNPQKESHIGKAYVELEDFATDSLQTLKKALLTAPRTLRFEAYSADEAGQTRTVAFKSRRRKLFWRSKTPINLPLMKSLRTVWRNTIGRINADDRDRKNVTPAQ